MKYSEKEQKQKTAIIYTRVSTDDQAEHGYSLAHQEDTLRKECARRGYHVVAHYREDGHSATTFKRPQFQELLNYLKKHKNQITYLLVTKWCRFSRDVGNSILMSRELQSYGTRVRTLDDGEDLDNPNNLMLRVINMTLPEIDNRMRARNTKSGILRALKEGHYPYGNPPVREELPLRGHLTCPCCGKTWTGSISSGNGGQYAYYHCERTCRVRVNAAFANERFLNFLGTLQPPQEIVDLQFDLVFSRSRTASQKKVTWFDLSRKIDLQRWKLSNHDAEPSTRSYPSEI